MSSCQHGTRPPTRLSLLGTCWNVRHGSNSVLPSRLPKRTSQYDLEEEGVTDVGMSLWGTTSVTCCSSRSYCRCWEKVSIDILLEHKNLGEEYLRHGYFREEPLSKMIEEEGGAITFAQSCAEHVVQWTTCSAQDWANVIVVQHQSSGWSGVVLKWANELISARHSTSSLVRIPPWCGQERASSFSFPRNPKPRGSSANWIKLLNPRPVKETV